MADSFETGSDEDPSSSGKSARSGWVELLVPLGLLTGIGLLAFCFVAITSSLSVVDVGAYLLTFLTSPGATIVAAVIAAVAIVPQIWHSRSIERQRTWWENYRWLVDRAWPAKEERALPDSMVIASMEALLDSAPRPWDRVLAPAIARFAEAVTGPKPAADEASEAHEGPARDGAAETGEAGSTDVSSLLVKLNRAGAASPRLEAQRYEHDVMASIDRAAAKNGWWTRREAAMNASDYYVAAPSDDRPSESEWVAIDIMASQSALRRALRAGMLQGRVQPDLLVGPYERSQLTLTGPNYVRWSNPEDDLALETAIQSLLASGVKDDR